MHATTIAVDLAKDVFEIAIADPDGRIGQRKRQSRVQFKAFLQRQLKGKVVMEACGTAHYWGRLAQAHGHEVVLLPPRDVRPYVRRDKTDRADAAGLIEAERCADIHPVPVKSVVQQEIQALHTVRRQWVGTRTARVNVLRALLREFGVVIRKGTNAVRRLVPDILADGENGLPWRVRELVAALFKEIRDLDERVHSMDAALQAFADEEPVIQRLDEVSGLGVQTATAMWSAVGDVQRFRRARQFAAWLGLPPREHSSGNRRWLGAMSKRGDPYLRTLLIHGARAVVVAAERRARAEQPMTQLQRWIVACVARCGRNKAAVATANKLARIVWAVWRHERRFGPESWPHPRTAASS